ncbi:MAG: hypothetical protein HXY34_03635 [Candidatus Thorarchaeota archaeon]|nr:hypothetical protein [Candidatus Thorarchaeota archaeon]
MGKRTLKPVPCPGCKDGTRIRIEIEEDLVLSAKKHPVMVAAKCENGHSIVAYVDARFEIRDVELAAEASTIDEESVQKTKRWLDSL